MLSCVNSQLMTLNHILCWIANLDRRQRVKLPRIASPSGVTSQPVFLGEKVRAIALRNSDWRFECMRQICGNMWMIPQSLRW